MSRRIPFIESMRPEPKRDEYGRYVLEDPRTGEERSFTRATTIAHTLSDDYHITQWKRRVVAEGIARRPELLELIPGIARRIAEADHWREAKKAKAELDEVCDQAAAAAGANDGSELGTLLHTITEYADAGRLDEIEAQVPDDLWPDLRAYLRVMAEEEIGRPPEFIERIIVNTQVESGGTLDRVLEMPVPCPACGGRLRIGDLKTQKTVDFGFLEIAIQLAEYAHADAMLDPATGELVPMPAGLCQCFAIVMHLPVGAGRCQLFEVDLAEGWEAALAAFDVRARRSRSKAMGWPYRRPAMPATSSAAPSSQALYLIRSATHPDALAALWRDLDGRGEWTPEMTEAARARKAQLTA